eukprot:maker-scaffold170_size291898-snap-gene-1.43 protein:Tk03019 transcript:maker-scaffold170_size291898-snap-gene-1.43-mRNA-1 annotation:"af321574_1acetylcholinesterase precursor"
MERLIIFAIVLALPIMAQGLKVSTEYGWVQGKQLTSSDGSKVEAFLGIPYAQPPVGQLRFRPPKEPFAWDTIKDGTLPPPSCHQRRNDFLAEFGEARDNQPLYGSSEDCLFLNIYAPETKAMPPNGYPVMVWFHGGGFSFGSTFQKGSSQWSPDPRELVTEGDLVVVTVQYRLGSLGFLFLDDDMAPGNVGLLDQQLALKWIKRNIFAFRGDPTQVTLAGQDAGGVSALMQAVLEDDEPFYQRLILQSSGIQHPWSYIDATEAFRRTLKLAALLGCSVTGSREEVMACMIQKSPEDIVKKEMGVIAFPSINFHPFVMTIDGKTLTAEPRELLRQWTQTHENVRILIGANQNEGTKSLVRFMPTIFPKAELTDEVLDSETFDVVVNRLFADAPLQIQKAIKFQYTNWTHKDQDENRFHLLTKMVADQQYDCPVEDTIFLMATKFQAFRYIFSVKSPQDQWPTWTGVKHGDEMDYVFGRPLAEPLNFSVKDVFMSKFLIRSWTEFVNTGHPSGRGKGRVVGWPLYNPESRHVLHIQNSGSNVVISDPNEESCHFWNELVPSMEHHDDECHQREKLRTFEKKKFKPLRIKTTPPSLDRIGQEPVHRVPAVIRRSTIKSVESTTTTVSTTTTPSSSTTATVHFMKKPVFSESIDLPPPINVLSKTSVLSADDATFKVLSSDDVITEDDLRSGSGSSTPQKTEPEAQKLSYSLSVMSRKPAVNPDEWTLFRPQEPGNSPIYVAKGTYDEEETTTERNTRPYYQRVVPTRNRPRRPPPTPSKPVSEDAIIYDPFNPATYSRSFLSKRIDQEPIIPIDREGNPVYYPNYLSNA